MNLFGQPVAQPVELGQIFGLGFGGMNFGNQQQQNNANIFENLNLPQDPKQAILQLTDILKGKVQQQLEQHLQNENQNQFQQQNGDGTAALDKALNEFDPKSELDIVSEQDNQKTKRFHFQEFQMEQQLSEFFTKSQHFSLDRYKELDFEFFEIQKSLDFLFFVQKKFTTQSYNLETVKESYKMASYLKKLPSGFDLEEFIEKFDAKFQTVAQQFDFNGSKMHLYCENLDQLDFLMNQDQILTKIQQVVELSKKEKFDVQECLDICESLLDLGQKELYQIFYENNFETLKLEIFENNKIFNGMSLKNLNRPLNDLKVQNHGSFNVGRHYQNNQKNKNNTIRLKTEMYLVSYLQILKDQNKTEKLEQMLKNILKQHLFSSNDHFETVRKFLNDSTYNIDFVEILEFIMNHSTLYINSISQLTQKSVEPEIIQFIKQNSQNFGTYCDKLQNNIQFFIDFLQQKQFKKAYIKSFDILVILFSQNELEIIQVKNYPEQRNKMIVLRDSVQNFYTQFVELLYKLQDKNNIHQFTGKIDQLQSQPQKNLAFLVNNIFKIYEENKFFHESDTQYRYGSNMQQGFPFEILEFYMDNLGYDLQENDRNLEPKIKLILALKIENFEQKLQELKKLNKKYPNDQQIRISYTFALFRIKKNYKKTEIEKQIILLEKFESQQLQSQSLMLSFIKLKFRLQVLCKKDLLFDQILCEAIRNLHNLSKKKIKNNHYYNWHFEEEYGILKDVIFQKISTLSRFTVKQIQQIQKDEKGYDGGYNEQEEEEEYEEEEFKEEEDEEEELQIQPQQQQKIENIKKSGIKYDNLISMILHNEVNVSTNYMHHDGFGFARPTVTAKMDRQDNQKENPTIIYRKYIRSMSQKVYQCYCFKKYRLWMKTFRAEINFEMVEFLQKY